MLFKKMFKNFIDPEPKLDKSFWQLYRARCDFYICTGINNLSSLKLKVKSSILSFIENEEDPYMYGIVVSDPQSDSEPLMFPLETQMKVLYCFDEENYAIDYFLRVDEDLTLLFKFKVKNKDFAESGQFREIIGRLFFQGKNKKPIACCEDEQVFYERVLYMPELNNNGSGIKPKQEIDKKPFVEKKKNLSSEMAELLGNLSQLMTTCFVSSGQWEISSKQSKSLDDWEVQEKEALFIIHESGQFVWEMQIRSSKNEVLSSTQIKEGLLYNIDTRRHMITWAGSLNNSIKCNGFRFSKTTNNQLAYFIPALILQTSRQKSFDQIISKSKNEWDQFYLKPEIIQKVDQQKYQEYIDHGSNLEIDFVGLNEDMKDLTLEPSLAHENPIQNFAQMKNNSRVFVSKKYGLDLYENDEDADSPGIKFSGAFPIVKLYDTDTPIRMGNELTLQEGDKRLIFTGHADSKDTVFYTDVSTGKVVNQYEHKNVKDVSRVGGKRAFEGPPEFHVIDDQGVYQYDTRTAKGVAKLKHYKTKVGFNRIFGGPSESFAIGSKNGDIRLYKKVGEAAKNLIPSLLGNSVLDIDVSSNGDFVLATCQKYLLLLPTFQNGASGFSKRFLKKEKPHPRVLRLDPVIINKIGVEKLNFLRAKFDEKDSGHESLIVGTTEEFVVIWILEDVLSGKSVSKKIQKIGGGVVAGQFRRNRDYVIAALKNELKVQKTNANRGKKMV